MQTLEKSQVFTLKEKNVTQNIINCYADAASDHNPLHVDVEFAEKTRYGGTIAHGMLSLAFVQTLLAEVFAEHWLKSGALDVNFMLPVRPGDTITAEAKIVKITPQGANREVQMHVICLNQRREKVIMGKARVVV